MQLCPGRGSQAHYDTSRALAQGVGGRGPGHGLLQLLAALGLSRPLIAIAARGPGQAVLCGGVFVTLAVLAANLTGNRSPGALDNGTGVATLLELARTWRTPVTAPPVEASGRDARAEEVGLDGARELPPAARAGCGREADPADQPGQRRRRRSVYLAGEPRALGLRRGRPTSSASLCPAPRPRGGDGPRAVRRPRPGRGEPPRRRGGWSLCFTRLGRSAVADHAIARAGSLAAHIA